MDAFEYMHRYGLPDSTCNNYIAQPFPKCNAKARCRNCLPVQVPNSTEKVNKCWAVRDYVKYYISEYGILSGEAQMMSEIQARGPITCVLASTSNLLWNYSGEIWFEGHNPPPSAINHDVEVVGWGEEHGVKYWQVRNSWGTYWGKGGFFRVIRGINHLYIEEECSFVIVDTSDEDRVAKSLVIGSMQGLHPLKSRERRATPSHPSHRKTENASSPSTGSIWWIGGRRVTPSQFSTSLSRLRHSYWLDIILGFLLLSVVFGGLYFFAKFTHRYSRRYEYFTLDNERSESD